MFDDLLFLVTYTNRLIMSSLSHPRGWREVYFIYSALDDGLTTLAQLVKQVDLLPLTTTRLTPSKAKIYGSPWNMHVDKINTLFGTMQASIVTIIDRLSHLAPYLTINDQTLQVQYIRLFGLKGILSTGFRDVYVAGHINVDDHAIYRMGSVILKCLTEGDKWKPQAFTSLEFPELNDKVDLHERIEVDTEEKRNLLVAEGRRQIAQLQQLQQELAGFIRQNCTLADLL